MVHESARQQGQAEPPTTTQFIPGVVAAGTSVERVWTGLRAADGFISEPDGTLLGVSALAVLMGLAAKRRQ